MSFFDWILIDLIFFAFKGEFYQMQCFTHKGKKRQIAYLFLIVISFIFSSNVLAVEEAEYETLYRVTWIKACTDYQYPYVYDYYFQDLKYQTGTTKLVYSDIYDQFKSMFKEQYPSSCDDEVMEKFNQAKPYEGFQKKAKVLKYASKNVDKLLEDSEKTDISNDYMAADELASEKYRDHLLFKYTVQYDDCIGCASLTFMVSIVFTGNARCPAGYSQNSIGLCAPDGCTCDHQIVDGVCTKMPEKTQLHLGDGYNGYKVIFTHDKTNHSYDPQTLPNGDTINRCFKLVQEISGTAERQCSSTTTKNPIDCATGQKKYTDIDYQGFGLDALSHTRWYQTKVQSERSRNLFDFQKSQRKWDTELPELHTEIFEDGSKVKYFTIGDRVSRMFYYRANANSYQISDQSIDISLEENEKGESVVRYDGNHEYRFNAKGKLLQYLPEYHDDSNRFTYIWDGDLLIKKSNRFGRFLEYKYDDKDRLTQLSDQDGITIYYEYDSKGNLEKVIYPDNTPDDLTDNPFKQYLFEDTRFPNNVTGIIDQDGIQRANIAYNEEGKATLSELHNGVERIEVSYPEDNAATVRFYRSTTDQLFREEKWYFIGNGNGKYYRDYRKVTYCNDCELMEELTNYYGPGGQLKTHLVYGVGPITLYDYDDDGRVVEKKIVAGEDIQTITYKWNDIYDQIETITTATEVTSYTYDDKGQLIGTKVTPITQ